MNNELIRAAVVRALMSLNPAVAGLQLADWIREQSPEVRERAIRLVWVCAAALEGVSDEEL